MTTYGVPSTYPPTQCGLATFSAALVRALRSDEDVVDVVALVDRIESGFPSEVRHQWVRGEPGGESRAAARLNTNDIVIVQHEYGIFGGADGGDVLDLVRQLHVPVVVVFHTVLEAPTVRQRSILLELSRRCDSVVTMTWTARRRLINQYGVPASRITVIPHGASDIHVRGVRWTPPAPKARPVLLTWGLLGQGKGIEWGIAAMALLRDVHPAPIYRIVGGIHPKVAAREGEAYRRRLERQVRELGVENMVAFDDRYIDTDELQGIVADADFILLPYDSRDQVTSGVLVEAVTAAKPVVSTGFPHAVELLSRGMGLLVERQSASSIAAAVRRLIEDPQLAQRMSDDARTAAKDLLWPAVADRYRDLAESLPNRSFESVSA